MEADPCTSKIAVYPAFSRRNNSAQSITMQTYVALVFLAYLWTFSVFQGDVPFNCQSADTLNAKDSTEELQSHPLPLLIQPDVRGEQITFISRGDVWVTSRQEKWVARNLTGSQGGESNPKLSQDGLWIAYNHPVDGVFVTSVNGDHTSRKRLTFKGNRGAVFGWTTDGRIGYAAYESAPFPDAKGLSFVRRTGGQPQHTGVAEIGYAWFAPNGRDMIYSKSSLGTGVNAKFHGGGANQILRFDLATGEMEHLYPSIWARHSAVVCKGETFFLGTEGESSLNLWKASQSGIQKLTEFTCDGPRSLSSDGELMVLEIRGSLYWFEPAKNVLSRIPIVLKEPSEPLWEATFNVVDSLSEATPTADGSEVAVVARGEILVSDDGRLENVSQLSNANDFDVHWDKEGKQLAFVSDRTGEMAIYIYDRQTKKSRHLTNCPRPPAWIEWSPTGEGLFYLLDRDAVHWVDARTVEDQELMSVPRWVTSQSVSQDGRWLAMTAAQKNQRTSVVLIDRVTKDVFHVTDPRYIDTSCVFDTHENILYFLSRRNGRPNLTQELPDLNLKGGMSLAKIDLRDPPNQLSTTDFRKRTYWIDTEGKDLDSLSAHPLGASLSGPDGAFIYDQSSSRLMPTSDPSDGRSFASPFGSARAELREGVLHVEKWDESWIPSAAFPVDMKLQIDLKPEWESMFWAVHRFHRDQFYASDMLQVDWNSLGQHYANYLSRLHSREELSIVLARLVGELPGGHNGLANSPSVPTPPSQPMAPETGLIVGWDGKGAKILRVLRGRTDMQMFGSLENGVEGIVFEGEYIRAVNGSPITEIVGFDELTVGLTANDKVHLEVSSSVSGAVREVEVRFLNHFLGYTDFLDRTIERVAKLSNGRIGYAHIFDTFSQGGGEFSDGFYSQWHLDGFLLDARWNRGGNSNPGFIDAMQARALFKEVKRYGEPSLDTATMTGPIAMLVNRETVSGGDLLAHAFRSRRLGSLVGDRTSGRTIGNQWYGQLIDGSTIRTSESQHFDWLNATDAGENVGVWPDVSVGLVPKIEFSTQDEQLDRAVQTLLKSLPAR